jgi:hypothetical protein
VEVLYLHRLRRPNNPGFAKNLLGEDALQRVGRIVLTDPTATVTPVLCERRSPPKRVVRAYVCGDNTRSAHVHAICSETVQ